MVSLKKFRHEAGFTVVELLLGIAVFAIVIPAIVLAIVSLIEVNQSSINLTYANIIAENKIETLRSIGYNSLPAGTTDFTSELPTSFGEGRSASYTISPEATGVSIIDVTLSYKSFGKIKTLDFKTLISELGVGQ